MQNYCREKALELGSKQRKSIVQRLEVINTEQGHAWHTFYTSVSILDNYLLSLSKKKQKAPCNETLAMACMFIAAKLDHAGTNQLNIFQSARHDITGMEIKELELEILIELEFSVYYPSALEFLMIYSSLLEPESKIKDEKIAHRFDKF